MAIIATAEHHADLATRLRGLVGEYAAASDRADAVAKLDAILLERITVAEGGEDSGVSVEDAKAMDAEIDRRGQVIADTQKTLGDMKAELEQTKAALEAATKPKADQ